MTLLKTGFLVVCVFLSILWPGYLQASEVQFPLTLDYSFLRSMLIRKAYTEPLEKALVVNKDNGCTKIVLWEPKVEPYDQLLQITNKIKVKAGVSILGKCLSPIEWEGKVRVLQKVSLNPKTWRFSVKTVDSSLLDEKGNTTFVAEGIYSLVKEYVHAYLDQFSIDLTPPKKDLALQLPLFFKPAMSEKVLGWLETMRLQKAKVMPKAVKAVIQMRVPDSDFKEPSYDEEDEESFSLSQQDLEAFENYWQTWDAYLIRKILSLIDEPLSEEERDELLAVVLDNRFGFLQALDKKGLNKDLVREQFLSTWQRLSPILRKHLMDKPQDSLFNYLAFFTATDALAVLDKLGPNLGIEISERGMMRLARLVAKDKRYHSLAYNYKVNPDLRELLGFKVVDSEEQLEKIEPQNTSFLKNNQGLKTLNALLGFWIKNAYASEQLPYSIDKLRPWLYWENNPRIYFDNVLKLIKKSCDKVLLKSKLPLKYHELLRLIVKAATWQESCFRQFIQKKDKLTYLRSYNRTSVGLMQINERVWRGIYEPIRLRWDIAYNAHAGCHILEIYLRRYALGRLRPNEKISEDILAKAVYAMYNAGPRHFRKYLARIEKGKPWLSDRLFAEKYVWVKEKKFSLALKCLD